MRPKWLFLVACVAVRPATAEIKSPVPVYDWERDCVSANSACITGFWPGSVTRMVHIMTNGGSVGTTPYTRIYAVDATGPRVLYVLNVRDDLMDEYHSVNSGNWTLVRPDQKFFNGVLGGKGPAPPDPGPGGSGDPTMHARVASYARLVSDGYDLLAR